MSIQMITTYAGQSTSSVISVLVCHGSMQVKFDSFHPLVQFLQKHFKIIYSIELPGHGSQRQFADVSALSVQEIMDNLYIEIDKICPREKLLVISYSVSGMLFIKLWKRLHQRNTDIKGVFIGTAVKIRPETSSLISRFFSEEMYIKLGWENLMVRQHGPNWKKTIKMINNWFQPQSRILPNDSELAFLKHENDNKSIFFILGKQDQPFKREDILDAYNFRLFEIEGDHFSYFVEKKSWPIVKEILEKELAVWYPNK